MSIQMRLGDINAERNRGMHGFNPGLQMRAQGGVAAEVDVNKCSREHYQALTTVRVKRSSETRPAPATMRSPKINRRVEHRPGFHEPLQRPMEGETPEHQKQELRYKPPSLPSAFELIELCLPLREHMRAVAFHNN